MARLIGGVVQVVLVLLWLFTVIVKDAVGIPAGVTLCMLASLAVVCGLAIKRRRQRQNLADQQAREAIEARKRRAEDQRRQEEDRRRRAIDLAGVDAMSGTDFEKYMFHVLAARGYTVTLTKATGDLGVDLVAEGANIRIAIQAKRYSKSVSRRAISDAVAGMHHYQCTQAMVITNSYFTPGAVALAASTGCRLVDRDALAELIAEYQDTDAVAASLALSDPNGLDE